MEAVNIKDLVKSPNMVSFEKFRKGIFYYRVFNPILENTYIYEFPVPIEDIGDATLLDLDKSITFMRWIRKAQEENTLILL